MQCERRLQPDITVKDGFIAKGVAAEGGVTMIRVWPKKERLLL